MLLPLIQHHVAAGSTIYSDCWRAYNPLSTLGYNHVAVDHSRTFADHTSHACTNLIEGTWAHLRRFLPTTGGDRTELHDYLSAFVVIHHSTFTFMDFIRAFIHYNPTEYDAEMTDILPPDTEDSEEQSEEESTDISVSDGANASAYTSDTGHSSGGSRTQPRKHSRVKYDDGNTN